MSTSRFCLLLFYSFVWIFALAVFSEARAEPPSIYISPGRPSMEVPYAPYGFDAAPDLGFPPRFYGKPFSFFPRYRWRWFGRRYYGRYSGFGGFNDDYRQRTMRAGY